MDSTNTDPSTAAREGLWGDVRVTFRGLPEAHGAVSLDVAQRIERMRARLLATVGAHGAATFAVLCKASGEDGEELARLLETTPATLAAWRSGETPVPRTAVALVAAVVREHLGVASSVREHLARMGAWDPAAALVVDYDPAA